MKFKDLGLEYSSENITIRTLSESDFDTNFQLLKKWNISEEAQGRISDSEVINLIKGNTQISLFWKSIMFLVFKNDTLIGSFIIMNDRLITLKTHDYKKPIFIIVARFIENINDLDINASVKLLIDSINSLKMKISTIYLFEKDNENYVNHFIYNGFKKLNSQQYGLKNNRFINLYKNSNIFIKNI